jgi:hypothetical protein
MLHQIKESTVLLGYGQVEYMGCSLTEVPMKSRYVVGRKSNKIGSACAMKTRAKATQFSLATVYIPAVLKRVYEGLELLPAIDGRRRRVFCRLPSARFWYLGGTNRSDLCLPSNL